MTTNRTTPKTKPKELPDSVTKILKKFSEESLQLDVDKDLDKRPIYCTTLYLAACKLETKFGNWKAYIFQDIIHKGYIIALAYGDIHKNKTLYTRVHSSCVTSETLRGCDCDCVQQLEGALETISKKGQGIFFYLMQEGRGVGYIAKARDRMLVQATNDSISTFEAYAALGLKIDYRQYRNVGPICKILGIDPEFVVLTNNPSKITALKELGLHIKAVENLEFKPSPYNLAYLKSKMDGGHILEMPLNSNIVSVQPPEPVIPFEPYSLPQAMRFVHAATYFLPIRPIEDEVILSETEFLKFFKDRPIDVLMEGKAPLIKGYALLRRNRYRVTIHQANLLKHRETHPEDIICGLLHLPYWFKVFVYFDLVTSEDFVILTYGEIEDHDVPVVRVHSEALFNRFPLVDTDNKEKYKTTLKRILDYGTGVLVLLYNDGRGAGLGAYAQDRMFIERGFSKNTEDSYEKLGIDYDRRDYHAALMLLKTHLKKPEVQMIMNSPTSLIKKSEYGDALNELDIQVDKWIFLEDISID